jgi:hypothetical protein
MTPSSDDLGENQTVWSMDVLPDAIRGIDWRISPIMLEGTLMHEKTRNGRPVYGDVFTDLKFEGD